MSIKAINNEQSFFKRPYSEGLGHCFAIEYTPSYGVTAPSCRTTNGNPYCLEEWINDHETLRQFCEWLTSLGYKTK